MKIHMYEEFPNFGDALNRFIWPQWFAEELAQDDDVLMFGIGTLLGQKITHKGKVIVCGSGCGYEPKLENVKKDKWDICFVRGPLTAMALGLPESISITDPAILTPQVIPKAPASGEIIFVPHWETSRNILWQQACKDAKITYVDPLGDTQEVVEKISSAKLVIAEAMHGAILADAYRVPWVAVSTSSRINKFKWEDWGRSLSIIPQFYDMKPLGLSDVLRHMLGDVETASVLEKRVTNEDGSSAGKKYYTGGLFLHALNTLYRTLTTKKFRGRLEFFAFWTFGPKIDSMISNYPNFFLFKKLIARSSAELTMLAKGQGQLSSSEVSRERTEQIIRKLEEIKISLAGSASRNH